MKYQHTYKRFGERAILIEWPLLIDNNILQDVINFKKALQKSNIKQIVEINSTYNSLCVIYDFTIENINDKILELKSLYLPVQSNYQSATKIWHIPVCYDDEFAIDIDELSKQKQLSKPEIIKRHTEPLYTVYFIGFLPGFLYLGGLDTSLHTNRKSSPNLNIKKGAVGIGGQQTGIYPQDCPGGWHIIGNSPIDFFNSNSAKPCFASAGDRIKFDQISLPDYLRIEKNIKDNSYKLKTSML